MSADAYRQPDPPGYLYDPIPTPKAQRLRTINDALTNNGKHMAALLEQQKTADLPFASAYRMAYEMLVVERTHLLKDLEDFKTEEKIDDLFSR